MNIYMIILKKRTDIDNTRINEKLTKEIIIDNMDTALLKYSELKESARDLVEKQGGTTSIALFCPIIHSSGILLERPEDSDYILIENFS